MTNATDNRKELADFLWEWAGNDIWAKLLVDEVIKSDSALSTETRAEVYNYFLDSIGMYSGEPLLELTLERPTYQSTGEKIQLISISHIQGVNQLASNQTLTFSPNLTVIYGENGSGKTGYSRILKALGFSYDSNTKVLPNIFGAEVNNAAKINYIVDGETREFSWNGVNKNNDLSKLSVFNDKCVHFTIGDRDLIVTPMGFHLFQILTNELHQLEKSVNANIQSINTTNIWASSLTLGTQQSNFIGSLTSETNPDTIKPICEFNDSHSSELERLNSKLAGLNAGTISDDLVKLQLMDGDLLKNIQLAEKFKTLIESIDWVKLRNCNAEIADLENQDFVGLVDVAKKAGVEKYDSTEFFSFLTSAEKYIQLLENKNYPDKGETCVYCKQTLDDSANELLKSYRTVLNDLRKEKLATLKNEKAAIIKKVVFGNPLEFTQPVFGFVDSKVIQPKNVIDYNENLEKVKKSFTNGQSLSEQDLQYTVSPLLELLKKKQTEIQQEIAEKKVILHNINEIEKTTKNKINELKDRQYLADKYDVIVVYVEGLKRHKKLSDSKSALNTYSLSKKTTEAREKLVTGNFETIFNNELEAFRKSTIKITFSFGTNKGNSKIVNRIKNKYTLNEVLSEGEQKAIGLAEFLTELQLGSSKAPIIFDDPVNSLDHHIIDSVGKRLLQLSQDRQIVIFTHSILLLNSLIQQSELPTTKQAKIDCKFFSVKKNFDVTGVIGDVTEMNTYEYFKQKLDDLFLKKQEGDEDKIAAVGYGYLRSAIEIVVENQVLQNTIKRYRKGVAFPALLRIDGQKLDTHKVALNDIYEKCCVSIDGHSSPEEIHTSPTMDELKNDYNRFKDLKKEFR